MLILIEKDSASRVPKECTLEQAQDYAAQFPVYVVCEKPGWQGETMPLADWVAAQTPAEPEAKTESGKPE